MLFDSLHGGSGRAREERIWMLLLLTREPDVLHCCRGAAPAVKAVVDGQSARRRAKEASMVGAALVDREGAEKILKPKSKRPPPRPTSFGCDE